MARFLRAVFGSAVFWLRRDGGGGEGAAQGGGEGAAHQPPLGLLLHPHLVGGWEILISL